MQPIKEPLRFGRKCKHFSVKVVCFYYICNNIT